MFGLLPLVVLGAIVYAIVVAARRHGDTVTDRGGGSGVKRLFVYAMMFASLVVAAIGVTGVIGMAISTAAARRAADLAGPLAMTVVGLPVFAALAVWVARTHAADGAERAGTGWAIYINATLVTTLATAVGLAFAVADNVITGNWRGEAVAGLLVWGGAWVGHWHAWRRVPPTMLPRTHLWLASAAGLWITAGAIGFLINNAVARAFDAANSAVVGSSAPDLEMAIAALIIGGAVWAWHWLVNGVRTPRSEGWYVYALLFGVLSGLAAAVWGAGFGLYLVFEWFLGEAGGVSAATHFASTSFAIAAIVVGMSSWRYHRAVVGPRAARERTEIDRIYDYLVAGLSLATVAVAAVILVLAFFEAIAPAAAGDGGGGTGINTLLAAVTLLIIGVPMWAVTWRRVQQLAVVDEEEVTSSTRRTYLFGIFGVGGAVAFGALISLLVAVFQSLLGEGDGGSLIRDIDVPVALLVTIGGTAAYHWTVYRAERHLAAQTPWRDVLLVGDGVLDVDEIARRVHAKVRVLHRLDLPEGGGPDTDAIVDAIIHAEGEHLLVLAGQEDVRVVPYE